MKRCCSTNGLQPTEAKRVALEIPKSLEQSDLMQLEQLTGTKPESFTQMLRLACEIQKADAYIQANACNKLEVIVQQVRFLKQQAENVLREAKLNNDLHHATCNFVKVPGSIYHLYKRSPEQNYFSMLSPQEWTNHPHQYLGSYRLENDYSWTPVDKIQDKDSELKLLDKVLHKNDDVNFQLLSSSTPMES